MKTIISTILLALTFLSCAAQNGGQHSENNVVRIQYIGYSFGTHTFKIVNKQTCTARIRTKSDQDKEIDIIVQAGDSMYVNVVRQTPGELKFRSKAETSCINNPDMGWVEINTSNFPLNLVEGNSTTVIRGPNKLNLSLINGNLKSSYGLVNYIQHIRVYNLSGILRYDEVIFARRSSELSLESYFRSGINIVEVIIVADNGPERFIFKYQK